MSYKPNLLRRVIVSRLKSIKDRLPDRLHMLADELIKEYEDHGYLTPHGVRVANDLIERVESND